MHYFSAVDCDRTVLKKPRTNISVLNFLTRQKHDFSISAKITAIEHLYVIGFKQADFHPHFKIYILKLKYTALYAKWVCTLCNANIEIRTGQLLIFHPHTIWTSYHGIRYF